MSAWGCCHRRLPHDCKETPRTAPRFRPWPTRKDGGLSRHAQDETCKKIGPGLSQRGSSPNRGAFRGSPTPKALRMSAWGCCHRRLPQDCKETPRTATRFRPWPRAGNNAGNNAGNSAGITVRHTEPLCGSPENATRTWGSRVQRQPQANIRNAFGVEPEDRLEDDLRRHHLIQSLGIF